MPDLTGQQLGKFRLVQLLGAGGYARVYKAEHIHLKTEVAIKVREDQMISQEDQEQFKREAQLLASLKHPHIVQVTDFDVIDYRAFLVLEYAPYGTPKLINGVPLSSLLVASYIKQIASALQYIHDDGRKLVHCDIKPVNMLLWENDLIKLSDFGIAERGRDSKALTLEKPAGTVAYMAPEHIRGKPVPASDQYSLAVVAYEWLSGDVPFHGSSLDIQQQHMYENPPPLHRRNPSISMAVEQVINRALRKNPRERYPRVIDFALELESALKNMAHSTLRTPTARVPHENALPPLPPLLLREQQQQPGTAPQLPHSNPLVLGLPTSDGFQAHFDPTMQESYVPETPLPEEPELPPHELILEQRKLLQHFGELAQEQLGRKNAIIQQHSTARHEAAERRRQDLEKTDDDIEHVRRYTADMKRQARQQGWYGLAKKFDKTPFAIGTRSSLTLRIADYRQEAEADRDIIAAFLKRYSDPGSLLTTSLKVGGACVVLVALVWGVAITSFHGWNTFTGTGLLLLPLLAGAIATGMFGYTNIARLGSTFHHLKQIARLTEETQQERRERIEAAYQQQLDKVEQDFQQDVNQFMRELHRRVLPSCQAEVDEFSKKLGFAALPWQDPRWQGRWQGRHNAPNGNASTLPAPPVTSIGRLTVTITPELPSLPSLPLLLSCPYGCNLLLETSGPARGAALSTALTAILRLLLVQQPGSVHFTFIDPARYGSNFEPFLWLAEHDILATGSVLASSQQIEQHLAELTGHIMRITQQRVRNAQAHVEPSRVLVVMDFPANFSPAAARNLLDIARNGPRCGISIIIVVDEARSLQALQDFEFTTLEQLATVIRSNGQGFVLQSDDVQNCRLELDRLPEESVYQPLLQSLKQSLHGSTSMERHPLLQDVLERPTWLARASEAKIWLGYASTTREPVAYSFNRQSGSNLLIVGKRSEMNTGLLLSSLMLLAAQQSPQAAQFYVLDLSTGTMDETFSVGNSTHPFEYVKQLLPAYTLQVVHRHNVRDTLPAFLTALNAEIQRRTSLEHVETSSLYLFICGLERINDLRQVNVDYNDGRTVRNVTKLLSQVLLNGSDFGMHTLAWCSTHGNFVDVLNARALAQFDNRVIFPTSSREEMQTLLDRADIPEISTGQALFFSRDELRLEKFRPFPPPSRQWLQEAAQMIRRKREA